MSTSHATSPTTPTFDAVLAVLLAAAPAGLAWALRGWAEHVRGARAAQHAANSFAKHRREFGAEAETFARALTVARCLDYGMAPDEAAELIEARVAARDAKAAA